MRPALPNWRAGRPSFGDIVTQDQYSNVHLVATGNVGNEGAALAASPMVQTVIEALAQSYGHVVIDLGSVPDVAIERFAGAGAEDGAGGVRSERAGDAIRAWQTGDGGLWRCQPAGGRDAGGRGLNLSP